MEAMHKTTVLAERNSLLLTALLLEVYHNDPAAMQRMTTTLNMLSVENLKPLTEKGATSERKSLLASGISAALSFVAGLPTLHWKLPDVGRR